MSRDEVLALLRAAREDGPRSHAACLLALKHGMRCSEVTGLRLGDVDLKAQEVRIRRLKGSLTTTQPLERHPGFPLLDEIAVLGRWLRARPDDGSEAV